MTRVVILGISGLDADLLRVYGPCLPDLRRLLLQSPFLEMRSCFPPEPAPAWASIYTGRHPANHGILERVASLETGGDVLERGQSSGETCLYCESSAYLSCRSG